MKQIGDGGNILLILLYIISLVIIALFGLVIDISMGFVFSLFIIFLIVVQSRLQKVNITSDEIIFTNIIGRKSSYSIDSIESIGFFIYPYCFIKLYGGKAFIFQIPIKHLLVRGFPPELNTLNYVDLLKAQIEKLKSSTRPRL
ncbi:MAG: hypothetical protein RLZZ367_2248 [Bacteroidota bacterium]|jgi:hypothetical protein